MTRRGIPDDLSGKSRTCAAQKADGSPCRAAPLHDDTFCFWHSEKHAKEAAEARRLGGLRRRREKTVEGAYELDGFNTVAGLWRVVQIAVLDTLGLENSLARARTLGYLVGVGLRALETGEFEERLVVLETAVRAQPRRGPSLLDEPDESIEFVEPGS